MATGISSPRQRTRALRGMVRSIGGRLDGLLKDRRTRVDEVSISEDREIVEITTLGGARQCEHTGFRTITIKVAIYRKPRTR